ncbi:MAG TPA: hypothetical protein VNE82_11915, partial [Candidatus Binataceae bacterium]|nr:hypothetical protein [Candidatus Binataceae bacterium]
MSTDAPVMGFVMLAPAIWRGRQVDLVEGAHNLPQTERACVLMFSGGRDSTLAALRLSKESTSLTLVTVTSDHL